MDYTGILLFEDSINYLRLNLSKERMKTCWGKGEDWEGTHYRNEFSVTGKLACGQAHVGAQARRGLFSLGFINRIIPYNLLPHTEDKRFAWMRQLRLYFSPARKSKPTLDGYNLFQWYIITRHSQQNSLIDPAFSERITTRKVFSVISLRTKQNWWFATKAQRRCSHVGRTSSTREICVFLSS